MIGLGILCLGAAVGAPLRYLTDRAVQARHDTVVPWGTLTVNVAGSLVYGLLVGLASHRDLPPEVSLGIGTGFCGALTTYSTFSYETVRLLETKRVFYAVANVAVSLAAGLGTCQLGIALGRALAGEW